MACAEKVDRPWPDPAIYTGSAAKGRALIYQTPRKSNVRTGKAFDNSREAHFRHQRAATSAASKPRWFPGVPFSGQSSSWRSTRNGRKRPAPHTAVPSSPVAFDSEKLPKRALADDLSDQNQLLHTPPRCRDLRRFSSLHGPTLGDDPTARLARGQQHDLAPAALTDTPGQRRRAGRHWIAALRR